ASEAARAGAGVVGGDTASADVVMLSVTALGDLQNRGPVLRSGARPGDVIAVAGPLGHSAAGLALLSAGIQGGPALVAAHLRPAPPYDAGPEAARLGATALVDGSGGPLADLGHVAAASGVQVNVDSSRLAAGGALREAAASLPASESSSRTEAAYSRPSIPPAGPSPAVPLADDTVTARVLDWMLTGGED